MATTNTIASNVKAAKPVTPNTRWMTVKQVAERYGVHASTIWRWVRTEDTFPRPVNLSPGAARWSAAGLDAYDQQKIAATAAA